MPRKLSIPPDERARQKMLSRLVETDREGDSRAAMDPGPPANEATSSNATPNDLQGDARPTTP